MLPLLKTLVLESISVVHLKIGLKRWAISQGVKMGFIQSTIIRFLTVTPEMCSTLLQDLTGQVELTTHTNRVVHHGYAQCIEIQRSPRINNAGLVPDVRFQVHFDWFRTPRCNSLKLATFIHRENTANYLNYSSHSLNKPDLKA